jgi:hypothetical protein
MVICLNIVYGCFSTKTAELNSSTKDYVAHNTYDTYCMALSRKSSPTAVLGLIVNKGTLSHTYFQKSL